MGFVGESGISVLLTIAAVCPCGVHSPAGADRPHFRSFSNRAVWRVPSTTNTVEKCRTGPRGSRTSVTHHGHAAVPGILGLLEGAVGQAFSYGSALRLS